MSEPIVVRTETPADRAAVLEINRAAFGADGEAVLVERLHADGDVVLGLVAVVDGEPVGHLLFSRLPITWATGETVPAAALGPLAVLPAWQRQGVGSALAREGLRRCGERGIVAVVVLGDPAYYTRFGFRAALASRLQTPWSGPHLMAIELEPGSLGDEAGIARYAPAFMALDI